MAIYDRLKSDPHPFFSRTFFRISCTLPLMRIHNIWNPERIIVLNTDVAVQSNSAALTCKERSKKKKNQGMVRDK